MSYRIIRSAGGAVFRPDIELERGSFAEAVGAVLRAMPQSVVDDLFAAGRGAVFRAMKIPPGSEVHAELPIAGALVAFGNVAAQMLATVERGHPISSPATDGRVQAVADLFRAQIEHALTQHVRRNYGDYVVAKLSEDPTFKA